jgi:two-component system NtrC family sensor kinase
MAKDYLDPDQPKDARVIRQLDRIAYDAVELMQAARIIKHPETQAPERVDLNELIDTALERVWASHLDAEGRIEVEKKFAVDLPPLYLERDRLLDTFISLIQNGVEAIMDEGTLTISTGACSIRDKPGLEIAISDTGVGIADEQLPHIFDIFATTKERGLGFGLWIDRTFIQGLGGEIEVQSEVGVGSTFTVRLPLNLDRMSS